jgi:hypothetical protein
MLTPVRLHTQVKSESRPPSHWSTHRPAPPKGRGPAVRVTAAMNPGSRWCRLRRRSDFKFSRAHLVRPPGHARFSGSTAQDDSLSAQAGPRPRYGPAGPHLRATIAGPARRAARLIRLCSNCRIRSIRRTRRRGREKSSSLKARLKPPI